MRFFTTALAVLGVASAYTPTNPLKALVARQAVVEGTGCATVDVDLPRNVDALCATDLLNTLCTPALRGTLNTIVGTTFLLVGNPLLTLCLCTEAGVITPDSLTTLRTQLVANAGALRTAVNTANGLLSTALPTSGIDIAAIVGVLAAEDVAEQTDNCEYPDGSVPVCSTEACAFECVDGRFLCEANATPVCLLDGETCGSSVNGRRRRRRISNDLLCETGRSACALPGNKFGFECLDTTTDVESCGGCAFPLPGARKGRDCTTLPHAANVACVDGGCIIESCLRGFVLENDECVAKGKSVVSGIVDEASEAVGGLAALVGKVASPRLRTQNTRNIIERNTGAKVARG